MSFKYRDQLQNYNSLIDGGNVKTVSISKKYYILALSNTNERKPMIYETVSLDDVKNATLLDVREVGEFANGSYQNAINIPLSKLKQTSDIMQTFDKSETYILYCVKGLRAQNAAQLLSSAGFTNIKLLNKGYA